MSKPEQADGAAVMVPVNGAIPSAEGGGERDAQITLKRRVPSPLLEAEFGARFRLLDYAMMFAAGCWSLYFMASLVSDWKNVFGRNFNFIPTAMLGCWVGLPTYLLVRLAAIVPPIVDHAMRQEIAITPITSHEFLKPRLWPHVMRCGAVMLLLVTLPLLVLPIAPVTMGSQTRMEYELILAYCTVLFSIFFGVVAALFGYIALAPRGASSPTFTIMRAVVFGLCFVGSVGVPFVCETEQGWIRLVCWASALFGACAVARAWYREKLAMRKWNEPADMKVDAKFVFAVMALSIGGALAVDVLLRSDVLSAPLSRMQTRPISFITVVMAVVVFIWAGSVASARIGAFVRKESGTGFLGDAVLVAGWLVLWLLLTETGTRYYAPRGGSYNPAHIWYAMMGGLSSSAHLIGVGVVAIIAVNSGRTTSTSLMSAVKKSAMVIAWYLAVLGALIVVRVPFGFVFLLLAHYVVLATVRTAKPLLLRLAAVIPVIFVIANAPLLFDIGKTQYDDWSLVFPYAAIWPMLAAIGWIFAVKNYLAAER